MLIYFSRFSYPITGQDCLEIHYTHHLRARPGLKLNEKVTVIFSPAERKIEFESRLFKYERTNINIDEYRLCVNPCNKNATVEVEFESIE